MEGFVMGGAIVAAAWGAQFAATFGGGILAGIINLGIAGLVSYGLASTMRKDLDAGVESGAHLTATRSTDYHLPLVYGTSRLAPNWVYIGTSEIDNKLLHMVGVLCEGPFHKFIRSGE
jgi:hypothetical protein